MSKKKGVFTKLSKSYFLSAKSLFSYVKKTLFLFKPIVLIISLLYSTILIPIGIIFGGLILFDWLSSITDKIRYFIIKLMETQSLLITNSFLSFILRPILLVLIAPFFILSVFIPKLSNNVGGDLAQNELSDVTSGVGSFKRINQIIWRAASNLFIYVSNSALILKPIAGIVAIIYSIILIIVGAAFFILIPLDFISRIIENIRNKIVKFSSYMQQKINKNMMTFLFIPIFLVLFAPLFLAIILIPKFTTNIDLEV